nr:glycoprotein N acetylgalactosamine [Hymenolepis microstoma]
MVKYLAFSNIKIVIAGFFIGMLCSIILTSSMNWYHPPLLKLRPFHDEHSGHHEGETILVDHLARKTPVMAFIFTSEKGIANRASQVKSTWADRFNEAVFFSDKEDPNFPTVALPSAEGWTYTRSAITYIYENYGKKFAFFMKVQDNNYVIVENLRELLRTMDSAKPLLIGRQMKADDGNTYVSEKSGYVISRAGLEKLAAGIKGDIEACKMSDSPTEQVIGKCAEASGLEFIHAVDEKQLEVFHPFPPKDFFNKFVKEKYTGQTEYQPSQMNEIITSCSDRSVSFFDVQDSYLYTLEYFFYHLYPYGIIRNLENYQEIRRLIIH